MAKQDEAMRHAVDERLVAPESRFEAVDGQVLYVSPADREHASLHSKLAALLEACCAEGYDVAVDMLTRTSETNDVAPDASVYPVAPDPETGGRQLEELAFEVVSTETLAHAQKKARSLRSRGVRRVFAIDAERRRVLELSGASESFEILDMTSSIVDAVLAAPLELSALLDTTQIDDAMGKALLRKKNAAIEEALREREAAGRAEGEAIGRAAGEALGRAQGEASARAQGEALGRAQGEAIGQLRGRLEAKRETLVALLRSRGLAVSKTAEGRIASTEDESVLDRWLFGAGRCTSADELLDD